MALHSINPYTNKTIAKYTEDSAAVLQKKLIEVASAQTKWKKLSIAQRSTYFLSLQQLLLKNKSKLAELITLEMGKPITQSYLEVEKCAMVCETYANTTAQFLQPQIVKSNAQQSYTHFEPLGNVLAVMPWNFPFWQVFRCMAPIMMGGNGYVLKHASNVYGCASAIQQVMQKAKFPKGIFQLLNITSKKVAAVIAHPSIQAITCTGSTAAGKDIAVEAAKHLKKCVLELGGNDGYVVLADADLHQAVKASLYSRMINNGQSCIAAKRFIVVKSVQKKFTEILLQEINKLQIGNPLDASTTIGPIARVDLRNELQQQVDASVAKGAKIIYSPAIPKQGAFFAPSILTNVTKGMPAYHDELFGPVCSIITAANQQEALQIANESAYGLGAAVFTADTAKGKLIAEQHLDAGNCFVNDFVRSVPGLAFGGVKQSGYGRELGKWGLYEFMNIKTVYIA
jgi:succinate-semialdehyde dehydrogenase / glutarate-semialdehyde dehydrogenase